MDTSFNASIQSRRMHQIVRIVKDMNLSSIRRILSLFDATDITCHHFLPHFGMTLGEFCVAYVIKLSK